MWIIEWKDVMVTSKMPCIRRKYAKNEKMWIITLCKLKNPHSLRLVIPNGMWIMWITTFLEGVLLLGQCLQRP